MNTDTTTTATTTATTGMTTSLVRSTSVADMVHRLVGLGHCQPRCGYMVLPDPEWGWGTVRLWVQLGAEFDEVDVLSGVRYELDGEYVVEFGLNHLDVITMEAQGEWLVATRQDHDDWVVVHSGGPRFGAAVAAAAA